MSLKRRASEPAKLYWAIGIAASIALHASGVAGAILLVDDQSGRRADRNHLLGRSLAGRHAGAGARGNRCKERSRAAGRTGENCPGERRDRSRVPLPKRCRPVATDAAPPQALQPRPWRTCRRKPSSLLFRPKPPMRASPRKPPPSRTARRSPRRQAPSVCLLRRRQTRPLRPARRRNELPRRRAPSACPRRSRPTRRLLPAKPRRKLPHWSSRPASRRCRRRPSRRIRDAAAAVAAARGNAPNEALSPLSRARRPGGPPTVPRRRGSARPLRPPPHRPSRGRPFRAAGARRTRPTVGHGAGVRALQPLPGRKSRRRERPRRSPPAGDGHFSRAVGGNGDRARTGRYALRASSRSRPRRLPPPCFHRDRKPPNRSSGRWKRRCSFRRGRAPFSARRSTSRPTATAASSISSGIIPRATASSHCRP